jgi:hypothetical protein
MAKRGTADEPWNPHIAVIPMMTLIVVAADAASGDSWMLPIVALLASFAGQTHVALLPSALVVGVRVLGVVRAVSSGEPRRLSAPPALRSARWPCVGCLR